MAKRKLVNPFKITKSIVERFDTLDRRDLGCYAILLPSSPDEPLVYETIHVAQKSWSWFKKMWKIDD